MIADGNGERNRSLGRHPQIQSTLLGIGDSITLALAGQPGHLSVGQIPAAWTPKHLFRHQKFASGYRWATNGAIMSSTKLD